MKTLLALSFLAFILLIPTSVYATHAGFIHDGQVCQSTSGAKAGDCEPGTSCTTNIDLNFPQAGWCQKSSSSGVGSGAFPVFGKIKPPDALANLGFGAQGLGNFLSLIIQLIYIAAGIAFVFMIVIAAFNWITSGGDKEKVGAAQKRITHAIIGIVLLAVAFVIIRLIGQITGFTFFAGQNNSITAPASRQQTTTQAETCQYTIICETNDGHKGSQTCDGSPIDKTRPYHPGSNPCRANSGKANCSVCVRN